MKTKAPTKSVAKGLLTESQVNIKKVEDNENATTNTANIQGVSSGQDSIEVKPDTVNDVLDWVNNNPDNVILSGWTDRVELLNESDRNAVKMAVKGKTKENLTLLNQQLKVAINAWNKAQKQALNQQKAAARRRKKIVEIDYDPVHTGVVTRKAARAIVNDTAPGRSTVFRYGNTLVSIQVATPTTVRGLTQLNNKAIKYPNMKVVKEYDTIGLMHRLEQSAVYIERKSEGDDTLHPWPKGIVEGIFSQIEVKFPVLTGIIQHSFIGSDGALVTRQGYDKDTGLFVEYDAALSKILIAKPKREDVAAALDVLCKKVLEDFPFVEKVDRIAAVAVFLTAIQRKLISDDSGCPGFLFDAPMQSSGKTTLAQVVSYSVFGRSVAASSWIDNDTEMAKLLLAILLEGHGCVLFDNLPAGSTLTSNELAKAMTGNSYSGRVLGRNRTATVPSNVLWLFTGNNISICGDFNTRIIPIRLDSRCADPDRRTFSRMDIGSWCLTHRAEIIKACLILIMADCSHLAKDVKPTRYPDWDRCVRLPLLAVSGIDVADKFHQNKQTDPELESRLNFLKALHVTFESESKTAKEIIQAAENGKNDIAVCLGDVFPAGPPTSYQLGRWLGGIKNQVHGGYRLTSSTGKAGDAKNKTIWSVERVNA